MINCCRATGFIFKKEDRSDTDRVFYVFTNDYGKLKIFAKSIRKIDSKLKSGIDIFSLSEVEFIQGKSKKTLTDAIFVRNFKKIKSSPRRFEVAGRIAESMDDFIKEQEKDKKIFDLLGDSLGRLNDDALEQKSCELVYYHFIWNFFSELGFKPELEKCACCSSGLVQDEIYFSHKEGGTICKKCFSQDKNAEKTEAGIIKILRLILKNDWATISKLKVDFDTTNSLHDISENYYSYCKNI